MSFQDTMRQEASDFGDLRDILISVVAHQKKDEDVAISTETGVALAWICHKVLGSLVCLDEAVNTDTVALAERVQCFYPLGCVVYVGQASRG